MVQLYARTKTIQEDKVSGFCPGCFHSTIMKLIGEVLEEMEIVDKAACVLGIGCCGLHMNYMAYDNITAPHGRAAAVASGLKRTNKDTLVYTYQGDGDFASIGLAESISAANRGENITVIHVNNGIYGMTGGQMSPTTLVGMKASTALKGRQVEEHGYPMDMCEVINKLTTPVYIERTSCNTPQNVIKTKKAIRKAFQNQLDGKGFSLVEVVSNCPTNWGVDPIKSLEFIEEKMIPQYPLGVYRDQ
ncbi:thiamine pyrophosphate-dependent enzyme [Fusibacter ferrireducens]|uniref:2-oxoglutarate oxidoreductase n=1 Tax=Fusibacter ferrireducens TaxID=2785058 RepID=A0ABR9ZW36_9FIRM|nr:thiamine pyrophosphate-dependent enzyme [Fusibacter ferrireducens]MBF4694674.1 2-oxoglutarate oxidoreductase [Fusibacter ferrireducens]